MADRDRTKFLENVWSIAKISSKTEQIGVLVTGLQKEVSRYIYYHPRKEEGIMF